MNCPDAAGCDILTASAHEVGYIDHDVEVVLVGNNDSVVPTGVGNYFVVDMSAFDTDARYVWELVSMRFVLAQIVMTSLT